MTLMTQVREMISKGENTCGSINNGTDELHGNSQTGTAWSFETFFFMQCVIDAHLVAYNDSEKRLDNA